MNERGRYLIALLCAGFLLTGCGGGSSSGSSPLTLCGNGQINSGEKCDDGNTDDSDDCTTICVPARCGDGVVHLGFEDCDGDFNLNDATCNSLNFAETGAHGTALRCSAACQYDTAACGPMFTPTPTATETPTPTVTPTEGGPSPTPTVTATPTPDLCSNSVLEPGETCESCPTACVVLPCTATVPIQTFRVTYTQPPGSVATFVQALVGYRSDLVSLPSPAGSRVTNRPEGTAQIVNDLNYAVQVTLQANSGVFFTDGDLFTIDFDSCTGAAAATPADFGCQMTQCSSSFGDVVGCTCTVDAP